MRSDSEILDAIAKAADDTQAAILACSDGSSPTEQEQTYSEFHDKVLDLMTKRQR
jgi:hypothetical protein